MVAVPVAVGLRKKNKPLIGSIGVNVPPVPPAEKPEVL
jgi:hypothetical protein